MNTLYPLVFLGSLAAVLHGHGLLTTPGVHALFSLSLALTLIPLSANLYDLIVNPKSRVIRCLDAVHKLTLANRYGPYKARKLLEGRWLTCHYLCLNYSMYTHDKVYVLEKCWNATAKEFRNLESVYNCGHGNDEFFTHQTFPEFADMACQRGMGSASWFEFYAEVLGRDDSNNQLSFKFKYGNGELSLSANFREYPHVAQILYTGAADVAVYVSLRKMVECLQYMPIIELGSYLRAKRRRGVGVLHCASLNELAEVFINNLDLKVYEMSVFENKWFIEDRAWNAVR